MNTLHYERPSTLHNPFALTAMITGWLSFGSLVALLGSILIMIHVGSVRIKNGPNSDLQLAASMTLIATGLILLIVPWIYWAASSNSKKVDQCRDAINSGKFLVHWRYDATKWQAHFEELLKTKYHVRADWVVLGFLAVMLGLIFLSLAFASDTARDTRIIYLFVLALIWAAIGAMLWFCQVQRTRMLERLSHANFAIVSTQGAYANGKWIIWGTAGRQLSTARVAPHEAGKPVRLVINIVSGGNVHSEEILVPEGQLDNANRAAQAINEAPSAKEGGGLNLVGGIVAFLAQLLRLFAR